MQRSWRLWKYVVIATVCLSLVSVHQSQAGTYTVTVDDAVLAFAIAQANASRAPADQWTPTAYLQAAVIDPWIKQQAGQRNDADRSAACATFQRLTLAQQATITTSLGGKSPCP